VDDRLVVVTTINIITTTAFAGNHEQFVAPLLDVTQQTDNSNRERRGRTSSLGIMMSSDHKIQRGKLRQPVEKFANSVQITSQFIDRSSKDDTNLIL
jgi:hypothetical protein